MTTAEYRQLIGSLVAGGRAFSPTVETASTFQVERGTALADRLLGRPVAPLPPLAADVVDAAGHRRPVYRPLLLYAHILAGSIGVDRWIATLEFSDDLSLRAADGAAVAAVVWSALAATVAVGPVPGPFLRLVDGQLPNGSFLRTTGSDNPETHWYHELVILHAAADYAIHTGDLAVWAAVERATRFHLNETEPDHATGQPWGLPAFVRVAGAGPLADALLHAVSAHQPAGPSGVALLLLADTLYGLRQAPAGPGELP